MTTMESSSDVTLDRSVLEAYFQGNPKAREEFVAFFRSNLTKSLNSLREAVEQRNCQEIEYLAHRMRGSVGYVGAYKIAKLFQTLEEQAPSGDMEQIQSLLHDATRCQEELFQCI